MKTYFEWKIILKQYVIHGRIGYVVLVTPNLLNQFSGCAAIKPIVDMISPFNYFYLFSIKLV